MHPAMSFSARYHCRSRRPSIVVRLVWYVRTACEERWEQSTTLRFEIVTEQGEMTFMRISASWFRAGATALCLLFGVLPAAADILIVVDKSAQRMSVSV